MIAKQVYGFEERDVNGDWGLGKIFVAKRAITDFANYILLTFVELCYDKFAKYNWRIIDSMVFMIVALAFLAISIVIYHGIFYKNWGEKNYELMEKKFPQLIMTFFLLTKSKKVYIKRCKINAVIFLIFSILFLIFVVFEMVNHGFAS